MVAAALLTTQDLMLAGPSPAGPAAIPHIVDALRHQPVTVPQVIAPVPLARPFAAQWAAVTGVATTPGRHRRAWALWQVTHPRGAAGQLRLAQAADMELLTNWLVAFEREALGGDATRAAAYAVAQRRIARQEVFVWDDGHPVAMAGTTRPTWHGMGINPVYTPPALRGRGYASACVATLSQRLLTSGIQFCTLFTDPTNPVSNAIYAQIGYRPLAEFDVYVFSQA